MGKMSIRVILKNGVEFTTKCKEFTLKRNGLDMVTGYNMSGIVENKPVYLDFAQVAAIVRVISDETPTIDAATVSHEQLKKKPDYGD